MKYLKKYRLSILGILLGGITGYSYYYFVGCKSGACAITSKPINSSAYGMVIGYLILSSFQKTKKNK